MYWSEIFQYLTLPLLIFVTYRIILHYLKKFDKKLAEDGEE
jgi:hypothetical protein